MQFSIEKVSTQTQTKLQNVPLRVTLLVVALAVSFLPILPIARPVRAQLGLEPTIEEIIITGIPDANNPMTNCPTTPFPESVELEAILDVPPWYERDPYHTIQVWWSGDVIPPGEGTRVGESATYEYWPAPGTHGNKKVVFSMTFYTNLTHGFKTVTKTKEFKLFFVRDGDDNLNGIPNWYEYWTPLVTRVEPPLKPMWYRGGGGARFGEYLYPGGPSTPAARSDTIAIDRGSRTSIDEFGTTITHENEHVKHHQNWVLPKLPDADGDWLPDNLEAFYGTDPNVQDTDGNGRDDEDELCYIMEAMWGVKVAMYFPLLRNHDWANPGSQSNGVNNPTHTHSQKTKSILPLSPKATFDGTYSDYGKDDNGNGLYDYLAVEVGVDVVTEGNYRIEAGLKATDEITFWTETNKYLNVGSQSVTLTFDGLSLRQYRADGPYHLVYLKLYDEKLVLQDAIHDAHVTSPYSYTEFERPTAEFTGTYSDYGTDTDGDGLYNYLAVDVGVNSINPGSYIIHGGLYDSSGNDITWAANSTYLDGGSQSIILYFDGLAINRHRVHGPYNLRYLSLSGNNQVDFMSDAYGTSAYSYTDFQRTNATFTGSYSDYGGDTDGDNIYDYLRVEVGIDVSVSGNYALVGWLYDNAEGEIVMASNSTYLNAGSQILSLDFDGVSILDHGADGPYQLRYLTLYEEKGALMDTLNCAYTTADYKFTDFGDVLSAWTTVPPTIDGMISPMDEWNGAAQVSVFSGSFAGSVFYVMNDANNLYLALSVVDSTFTDNDAMRVRFDNDHNGIVDEGDDKVSPTTTQFKDNHFNSSAAGWGTPDSQIDGSSAAGTTGTTNFFEVSHPLNSGDPNDFNLSTGDFVGFSLTYFNDGEATEASIYPTGSRLVANKQYLYGDIVIAASPVGLGDLVGQVTDPITSLPIAAVTITAGGYSTITDANGLYAFQILEGTYEVTASAPGYVSQTAIVTVIADTIVIQDFALSLTPVVAPSIESSDAAGNKKDIFVPVDEVYVTGDGYSPSTTYDLHIVEDVTTWTDGMAIPPRVSGTATSVSSDAGGNIPATLVWGSLLAPGKYDIVVDVNSNGIYEADTDALDDSDVEVTAGFFVIPEVTLGAIMASTAMIIALVAYVAMSKWRRKPT